MAEDSAASVPFMPGASAAQTSGVAFGRNSKVTFERSAQTLGLTRSRSSLNNFRSERFNAVLSTVQHMGRMPIGHPIHIDHQLAARAVDLIGVLNQLMDVDVPMLFPLDDDTLVLKWSRAGIERFLTLSVEDVDLVEKHVAAGWKCVHDLGAEGKLDLQQLFSALDNPVAHSVSIESKDAREL